MLCSMDLRIRVVDAYKNGENTYEEVADDHGVGRASVSRWLRLDREKGSPEHRWLGHGRPRKIDTKGEEILRSLLAANADLTVDELTCRYNKRRKKKPVSNSTVDRVGRCPSEC